MAISKKKNEKEYYKIQKMVGTFNIAMGKSRA